MMRIAAAASVALSIAVLSGVGCARGETVGGQGQGGTTGGGGAGGAGGSASGNGGAGRGGMGGGAGSVSVGTAGVGGNGGRAGTSGGGNTGGSGPGAGTGGTTGGAGSGGSAACDPLSNAGCAAGTKCTVLQTPTSFALGCGGKGAKAAGATCTQTASGQMQTGDDCADGLACFALQGETTPTCRQFCMAGGSTAACPTGMACNLQINNLPGTSFCRASPSCTLLPQTGCPTGQACYLVSTGSTCAPAGHAAAGAACTSANDCAAGSTCITTNGASTCASFCSLTGGTGACATTGTGGATCTATPGTPPEPSTGICR